MYAVFLNKTAFHLTLSKKTWSRGVKSSNMEATSVVLTTYRDVIG